MWFIKYSHSYFITCILLVTVYMAHFNVCMVERLGWGGGSGWGGMGDVRVNMSGWGGRG